MTSSHIILYILKFWTDSWSLELIVKWTFLSTWNGQKRRILENCFRNLFASIVFFVWKVGKMFGVSLHVLSPNFFILWTFLWFFIDFSNVEYCFKFRWRNTWTLPPSFTSSFSFLLQLLKLELFSEIIPLEIQRYRCWFGLEVIDWNLWRRKTTLNVVKVVIRVFYQRTFIDILYLHIVDLIHAVEVGARFLGNRVRFYLRRLHMLVDFRTVRLLL